MKISGYLLFLLFIKINNATLIQNISAGSSTALGTQHVNLPELLVNKIRIFKVKIVETDKPNGFEDGEAELTSNIFQFVVYSIFDDGEIKFVLKDFKINQFSTGNILKILVDKQKMELRFFKTGRTILTKSCVNTNKDEDCIAVHTKLTDGGSLSFTLSEDGSVQLSEQTDPIPSLGSFDFESATNGRKAVKMVFDATGMRNAQIKLKFSTPLGELGGESTKIASSVNGVLVGCIVAVIVAVIIFFSICCLCPKCYLYKCRKYRKSSKLNKIQPMKASPVNIDRNESEVHQEQTLLEFLVDLFKKYNDRNPESEAYCYIHRGESKYRMPKSMSNPPDGRRKRRSFAVV